MIDRRTFIVCTAAGVVTAAVAGRHHEAAADKGTPEHPHRPLPRDVMASTDIPQFRTELPIPATMTPTSTIGGMPRYDVGVRQVSQQMLPPGLPKTTVWAYGPANGPVARFATPSMTIETTSGRPVQVRWVNQLVDARGRALPHLLPVDPTLHWANPERRPGHMGARTDAKPDFTGLTYVPPSQLTDPATQYTTYRGPVPLVAHLHGAVGVGDESDGYPEAWVLPAAVDIPKGYASHGTWYEFFAAKSKRRFGTTWAPGTQVSHYPNRNRASALWFHDHALGLTRLNVYAGPVGFYMVRESSAAEKPRDRRTGAVAVLPGGPGDAAPRGSAPHELPVAVQDRAFHRDGSLYYPDTRAAFDDYAGPYTPATPVPPVWNPEFFGNTIVVNGVTWPKVTVERRRYRLRLLNGCGSRALVIDFASVPGARAWQIGNDGGYLPAPVDLTRSHGRLVLAPAERADVILDLTGVREGRHVLRNLGPDEPYKGDADAEPADPATTGRILRLDVVARRGADRTTPPEHLVLPAIPALPKPTVTRRVALAEHQHALSPSGETGPTMAMLGVVRTAADGTTEAEPLGWMDDITENPAPGATETWEVYNFTEDAHPVHLHEVAFEVLGRAPFSLVDGRLTTGRPTPPEPGEPGRKDTVIAAPGEVTRLRATFGRNGQYVWHCHVLEHEDNEMMRPFRIGARQPGQPG